MDLFDEGLLQFFGALEHHKVAYIVVGGYAVNLHGYRRFTQNLDLWIDSSFENKIKLSKAFQDVEIESELPILHCTLKNSLPVDLVTEIKALKQSGFAACYHQASIAEIDGVKVPFLSLDHLIIYKKQVNRPKDRVDVEALELIPTLRENLKNLESRVVD